MAPSAVFALAGFALAGFALAGCVRPPASAALPEADPPPLDVDATFTDDAGTTGAYRLIAPAGAPKPGVLLFFTADYAGFLYATQAESRADLAAAHGLLVVGMANPDLPPGNACWWTPQVTAYAHYVDRFVRDVLDARYHVDLERVFLTGLSGGSDFAAAFHYHTDYRYRGGSVALCGGDVPRTDGGDCAAELDPPAAPPLGPLDPDVRDGVRYDYAIDATDPLLDYSLRSAAFYRDAGFAHVTHRVVDGAGHCGFADGYDGLDELSAGLDLVDPLVE